MTTSQRKRRVRVNRRTGVMVKRRALFELEAQVWDRMPAVGREFGSPDFDRLMEEDFHRRRGVFDPTLAVPGATRRLGFLKGALSVPQDFDEPLPEWLLADFEGGGGLADVDLPEDLPSQPRKPL